MRVAKAKKRGKQSTTGRNRAAEVIARLKGSGTVKMSTDQILALTRGDR
ncbi:MAG TPA: hypothetical protein VHO25_08700 [Polyangiaceae bacterium]|nr:hypothetical protein [Polyangiaceae bacterium]